MAKTTNWGIIGLGKIAHKFAQDLTKVKNAHLLAVASSSSGRAQEFANAYGAPHAYGSYEGILDCPDLDVVYVATPHNLHHSNTLLCLQKGIAVLCEKPFAIHAGHAAEMIAMARAQDTFLMEALWTRFLPVTEKTLELIASGAIGEVLSIKADFGFKADFEPRSRLYDPHLGGGALLDIGIYPAFLAQLLLGKPSVIKALAHIGPTGVDEETGVVLQYDSGQMAHLHASIRSKTKTEAFIYGEHGTIHIHTRWHESTGLTLLKPDLRPQDFSFPMQGRGYHYEAQEVIHCLEAGLKESPRWPLASTQALMELLDAIRREAGIVYAEDGV
ncbi:MAG: Gfo/Idh/MocA family oxidoreductase [Saprospiraceae bacterium]|nr:Gfo/Idh/MocA family oxidoreductase [Saprospiraceae bacterium]